MLLPSDNMTPDDWFASLAMETPPPAALDSEDVLPPNTPDAEFVDEIRPELNEGGPLNTDVTRELLRRDSALFLVARVKFTDLSGQFYTTDFCVAHLSFGPMQSCSTHNEMK